DDQVGTGTERAGIVADAGGAFAITIKPARGVMATGAYTVRAVSRHQATDADRWLAEARKLRTAGAAFADADRHEAAQPLYERALALPERACGPDELRVAQVVAELAGVYTDLPDYPRAQSLYQRATAMMDNAWGAADPRAAFTRTRLARVFQLTGQGPQAEA